MTGSADRERALERALLGALLLGTLLAYLPALSGGILNWDDHLYLEHNRPLLELDLPAIATDFVASNYQPLSVLTLALELRLFGPDPFHYHLVNVLLHVLNTLLVFRLVRRLAAGSRFVAFASAALFGLHPLHVESVAWISERKDVLSVCFYLAMLLAYLRFRHTGSGAWYGAALAASAAALLSKPMAVSAPLALLALDWRERRPLDRGLVLEKVPFFALALAVGIANLTAQPPADSRVAVFALDAPGRAAHLVESLAFYVSKTLWPTRLSAIYDAQHVRVSAGQWALFAAAVAFVAGWCWRNASERRNVAFGAGLFLVTIAPVLKLLPFGSDSLYNDRYMYLPSVGFFFVAALPFRDAALWRAPWRRLAVGGWIAVCALLAAASAERCKVWRDSETLWSDVLRVYPETAVAFTNLGTHALDEEGDAKRALELFSRATEVRPDAYEAWFHAGRAHAQSGEPRRAAEHFERALALRPEAALLRLQVAHFYVEQGDFPRAIAHYARVVEDLPDRPELAHNLGDLYLHEGQLGRARTAYERALEVNPDQGPTHAALAKLLLLQGNDAGAREHHRRARELGARVDPAVERRLGGDR